MDAATYAVTKRYTTPFGAPRGTKPTTWPDDKGFLGKPADTTTGLTHIDARDYDPSVGQFISVDPLLTLDQHQSLNGYSYANNTPVTESDPTGTCTDPGNGHCMPTNGGDTGKDTPPTKNSNGGGGSLGGGGVDNKDKGTAHGGSGGGGGCDSGCQQALSALLLHDWKDDANEKDVHAALAAQLQDYILATAGNTHPCSAGESVASGTMAACNQLGGNSPQLSWTDLLKLWAFGKGANVPFDAGSPLTQQLAGDKHNVGIVRNLMERLQVDGFSTDISTLGGQDDYVDGKNLGEKLRNFPKDLGGMATGGHHGTDIPDAFTGGYDEVYQVINKSPKSHSFTVAFAAFNDTGTASLVHFGAPDIKQGFGGASVYQTYYWTVEVHS